jgi:hypothetical protein
MILKLPEKLQLPNYVLTILREKVSKKETDDSNFIEYGTFDIRDYTLKMQDINKEFNPYIYIFFVIHLIGFCNDLRLKLYQNHTLALFLYHLLQYNSILKLFKKLSTSFKGDHIGTIDAPTFPLELCYHDKSDLPIGSIIISDRIIKIFRGASPQLKQVILMHELIEWASSIYGLNLNHFYIQNFAETLTFVLNNNKFTT